MKPRPEFISIGIITGAHGIKGEILVTPLTDNPQQFKNKKNVFVSDGNKKREQYTIQSIREKKKNLFIIKLNGVDNRNQAISLQKLLIEKQFEKDVKLAADEYYIFDVIGLDVQTIDKKQIGKVKDVLSFPANDVYVVKDDSKEILIPAIKSVIKKVDLEKEILFINPIDGLL